MKKFLALTALVLGLASCQTEPEGLDVNVGGAVNTEITVSLPDMTTRAGGSNSATSDINAILANDDYTMRYMLQVFYGDKPSELYVRYSDNQKVSFPVRLVPGEDRDYNFVVWADIVEQVAGLEDDVKCADLHYAIGADLREISVKDDKWVAMDETRDAFTAVRLVENYTGSQAIDIDLYRPFAKLRVITTDMVELTKHDIIPYSAVVTYKTKHRVAYNALTGEAADASATKEHSYTIAPYGDNTGTDRVLFTDYFFAEDTDVVKFEMLVEEENGDDIVTRVFNTDISVKPNYLTTLKGDILTNGTDVNVTVKPDMGGNHDYEVKYVNSASGLQDAIDEIPAGGSGSITLEGDIDLGDLFAGLLSTRATVPDYCIEIPANVDITLDLNGKNVTTSYQQGSDSKHMYAFKNNGLLTITDSSAEGNGQIIARGNYNYGAMTLESGSIVACDGNGGYGVCNYENATFVMNGGSICTSNEDGDLPGAGYDATTLRVESGAKATINGGTINNICDYTFAIENHGTTTVKGGTITSVHSTVANYGTMTINGGSFTCNGLEGITAHALWAAAGTTTINGGTFDGKDNYNGFNVCASAGAEVNIYGGVFNPVHSGSLYGEGTINVMGGEFFDDPSARVVEGYKAIEGNNVWTVVVDPVAQIGNTKYDTLQEAFEAGGEITLLRNVTLAETVILAEGQTVVLNLDGKTITGPNVAKDAEGNRIHVIVNNGTLTINGNGTVQSIATNGGSAICNNAGANLTINNVEINGAPLVDGGWPSYGINNYGTMTINGAKVNTYHGGIATGGNGIAIIEDATVDVGLNTQTKQTSWALYVFDNGQMTVNGGTFKNTKNENGQVYGGGYICAISTSKTIINGGTFDKTEGDNNGTGFYYQCKNLEIKGGVFDTNPSKYVADGYNVIEKDNTYTVIPSVLKDGDVLDLGGVEYDGTITVEGNVTIKGDTKITTLKSTTGCTITIEDGKTLTLNNFSFGAKDNANAEYEIKGGTVTANYGFFQHGKYALRSNFETGYMYYSYGSDITVYGTFHSQGKGDGLDYVRGKLTIAKGGKSIHDKSLWVGQPASWGAMNASLVIEEGGYVQANSLSVYEGSSLTYSNDADLKYNSVTGAEYITKK